MNKKLIIGVIVVIILILLGIFLFGNLDKSTDNDLGDSDGPPQQPEDLSELSSDEEVFNQIDDSLNYIE